MATQAEKNMAYGMQIRLQGMIRRGSDPAQIDALRVKYENLIKKIERKENVTG